MHLYVYDHCPFCVKARMIFGLHQLPVALSFLPNDDEETPIRLIGKKMLPIVVKDDQSAMGESLDIIQYIEQLNPPAKLAPLHSTALAEWLSQVNQYINKLLLPVMPVTDFPEFSSQIARDYYSAKKEAMVGSFEQLRTQRSDYVSQINHDLQTLSTLIKNTTSVNEQLSLDDIHLFPLLRNLTLIKEIQWPEKVAQYRDSLASQSGIPLLFNLAK